MLNKSEKQAVIDSLKADFDKAQAVFLTNLIGITANDAVALRKEVREAGGKVAVSKNTFFAKASAGHASEEVLKDLKGPHAIAFAFEDAAAVAKALDTASKENEIITLKAGVLDGKVLSAAEMKTLASLPSRDEMLGTLLATFNAPISALARVLNSVREKKEEEAA